MFFENVEKRLYNEIDSVIKGVAASEDFFAWSEKQAFMISTEAYKRSLDLSGKK